MHHQMATSQSTTTTATTRSQSRRHVDFVRHQSRGAISRIVSPSVRLSACHLNIIYLPPPRQWHLVKFARNFCPSPSRFAFANWTNSDWIDHPIGWVQRICEVRLNLFIFPRCSDFSPSLFALQRRRHETGH